ncbi:NAD(P)H-quinone oxidoreductase [Alkalimonas collagenimarina]|uniref:NAD(P)H-quinone oxidoreductase n=1 Tax=Alkalimonas collagenimarina TaxID=400390 RepID=A0ABT9H2T7_9GAMM|nr:NAD(P)H-quinone oxidoreductase [Alkalimonas collagenimarina]MDP4537220.1 NAD(P)H-quinone oxidoreductase [Alkalimonas collagenimarina]
MQQTNHLCIDSLPEQMQAMHVVAAGKQSQLALIECPLPVLQSGQVLISVTAAGVNRADLMQRQGLYPAPKGESEILGLEVSGRVVAVADAHLKHWLGCQVMALVLGGGYATFARAHAEHLMPVPKHWTMVQAAAMPEVFLTAYQLLFRLGQLQQGQRVLLHAGASGVGTAAIQLACRSGARVAVTASSPQKLARCQALGAELTIDYTKQDFVAGLKAFWPDGVDLILDPVAGDYIARNVDALALDGKIVIYALMGGRQSTLDMATLFRKRGQLLCSTLRNRTDHYKSDLVRDLLADFGAAFECNELKPELYAEFNWHHVEQAHQLLASNATIGKVILTMSDPE